MADLETPYTRDALFEQLLRLAASYPYLPRREPQRAASGDLRRHPLAEDIQLRAYQIYLERGASHGHDLDDWLQAECQVMEELKRSKASLRLALAFGFSNDRAQNG